MADKTETPTPTTAPALETATSTAAPANCTGELKELPAVEGTTYNSYECQTCHQVLYVGLEEDTLPTEHSPVIL